MFNYSRWLVDLLAKAAGHKYIKRIPYMSGGKTRYRYIYKVTHMAGGKHVLDPEHMVVGAAFMLDATKGSEVHAHIAKVDGDMVTYRLDDGPDKGKVFTVTRAQLASKINETHGVHEALAGAREKQAKVVADLRAGGASDKHVAREQARLDRLSAATPAPAPEAKNEGSGGEADVRSTAVRLLAAVRAPTSYYVDLPAEWTGGHRYAGARLGAESRQLLEEIVADPARFSPPTLDAAPTKTIQRTSAGETEEVVADVVSASWVPAGYTATLDRSTNMITLTVSEGAHAGTRLMSFPSPMLNAQKYRDLLASLPIVSAETMREVRAVFDAFRTRDALAYDLAVHMGDIIVSEITDEDAKASGRTLVSDEDELAEEIRTALDDHYGAGYRFRVSTRAGQPRIYVSRKLSRGWQDMGYISINNEGEIHDIALTRQVAELRDFVQGQLDQYQIKES